MIWSAAWFKGMGERALKTLAQTLVALIGAGQVGILDVDWQAMLSVAAMAAVVSILTSVGNADFVAGEPSTPLVLTGDTVFVDFPTTDGILVDEVVDVPRRGDGLS